MSILDALKSCAGRWQGTNRLHYPDPESAQVSDSALTIEPILHGKFLRIEYSWVYQGSPQQGSLILGGEPRADEGKADWIDTWHMGHGVLRCQCTLEDGRVLAKGSYAAPPGPDWGWHIELIPVGANSLRMLMHNITPDGHSSPAVTATYLRDLPGHTGEIGSAHGLRSIGQIAITVSDVGQALPFYRDVLGLQFLFSAGPGLAFLSAGDLRLMLSQPEGAGQVGANSVLYFRIRDVEAVHRAIVARGAASEQPPHRVATMPDHELWIGFVRDPDGNLIGLMEEKPLSR